MCRIAFCVGFGVFLFFLLVGGKGIFLFTELSRYSEANFYVVRSIELRNIISLRGVGCLSDPVAAIDQVKTLDMCGTLWYILSLPLI